MKRSLAGILLIALAISWAQHASADSALTNCKYYTKTQQDFQQGLKYCEQCIREEPDNPEARYYGAWCLAEMGRYADAWPSFAWLIERSNSNDKNVKKHAKWASERVQAYFAAHFNKGIELLKKTDIPGARDEFMKATQINPAKADGFLNLGYAQNELGDTDNAIESFRKAIEIAPNRADSYEYYSTALGRKRETLLAATPPDTAKVAEVTSELKKTLDQVVKNNPSNDAALLQLGDIALAEGDEEGSLAHFQRAIEIAPENVVKLYNVAVGSYQRGEYAKAGKTFGLVAEKVNDPEDDLWRDALYNQGLALREAGDYPNALACATKLLEVNDADADYHVLASSVYQQMKDVAKATHHAERAEQLKSTQGKSGANP